MQQIVVDIVVLAAVLFLGRGIYRSVISSRRAKTPGCGGCGTCEAGRKDPAAATKI